ncbi:MAG: hypothetical protein WCT04_12055 [Planctomycetota bacterium]
MSQENKPTHQDLELTLRLYDMRRETVTRQSRDALNFKFWPKSYADVKAVSSDFKHELNAPWRQMTGYWEMVYGFAKNGLCHAEFLVENNGEGLFLFAKLKPFLAEMRNDMPTAFQNTEWVTTQTEIGKTRLAMLEGRIKAMMEKM